jgi:hypothetical protein
LEKFTPAALLVERFACLVSGVKPFMAEKSNESNQGDKEVLSGRLAPSMPILAAFRGNSVKGKP